MRRWAEWMGVVKLASCRLGLEVVGGRSGRNIFLTHHRKKNNNECRYRKCTVCASPFPPPSTSPPYSVYLSVGLLGHSLWLVCLSLEIQWGTWGVEGGKCSSSFQCHVNSRKLWGCGYLRISLDKLKLRIINFKDI